MALIICTRNRNIVLSYICADYSWRDVGHGTSTHVPVQKDATALVCSKGWQSAETGHWSAGSATYILYSLAFRSFLYPVLAFSMKYFG